FLPLISARSDFIADSAEFKLFYQIMQAELDKILREMKKQKEAKNIQKITKELQQIMKQVREALLLNPDFVPQGRAVTRLKKAGKKKLAAASADFAVKKTREEKMGEKGEEERKTEEESKSEGDKQKNEIEKLKIEARPLVMKRIKLHKLGIACSIVSLGEEGPEAASQGNAVYINQDHPLYQELYKKHDTLMLHLLRLITQEIVLMKKLKITAREAFEWQGKLIKDAVCKK
ncbi:MAG: hypothetical protein Q8O21_00665, partial [bacterium]|nr:hypothetical protein [bacterium]